MSSFFHTFFLKSFKPRPKKGLQEKFFVLKLGFTGQRCQKIEFKTDVISGFGLVGQMITPFAVEISGSFGGPAI